VYGPPTTSIHNNAPDGPAISANAAQRGAIILESSQSPARPAAGGAFMGHPKGLFYLAFTEAWERFSYYGMTALLVLYMVNELLLPGHVEHIGGFAGFRAAVESVVGPLSTQALASQIFGLYSGFVYFTPILGGLIADPHRQPSAQQRDGRQ
jgi:dipeptide/tripeptide permease